MLWKGRIDRVAIDERRTADRRTHAVEGQIWSDDEACGDAVRIRMDVAEIPGDACA